jgi:hypothetical protein
MSDSISSMAVFFGGTDICGCGERNKRPKIKGRNKRPKIKGRK